MRSLKKPVLTTSALSPGSIEIGYGGIHCQRARSSQHKRLTIVREKNLARLLQTPARTPR